MTTNAALGDFAAETDTENESPDNDTDAVTHRDYRPDAPDAHNPRITNKKYFNEDNAEDNADDADIPDGLEVKINTGTLKALTDTVKRVAETVRVHADDDGLVLRGVDAANVVMIETRITPGDTISYEINDDGAFPINVEALSDAVSDVDRGRVTLSIERTFTDDDAVGQLSVNDDTVTLPGRDGVRKSTLPDLEVAAAGTLPTDEYRRGINATDELATNTTISWSDDAIHFHAPGDTDDMHVELDAETIGDDAYSIYSNEYLDMLTTPLRRHAGDSVTLAHLSYDDDEPGADDDADDAGDAAEPVTEYPAALAFETAGIDTMLMIAPRIQSTDNSDHSFRVQPDLSVPGTDHGSQHNARYNLPTAGEPIMTGAADTIKQALSPLGAKADESKLTITSNGINTAVIDPANVMAVTATIDSRDFDEWHYDAADPVTLGIAHDRLFDYIDVFPDDATISVSHDPDNRVLSLAGSGTTVNMALIDPDSIRRVPDVPELEHSGYAFVPLEQVEDAVDAVDEISDHAGLSIHDGSLFVHSECTDRNADDDGHVTQLRTFDGDGHANGRYSIEYLENVFDAIDAGTVNVYSGVEQPVIITYDAGLGHSEYSAMISPRVKDDMDLYDEELLESDGRIDTDAMKTAPNRYVTREGDEDHSVEIAALPENESEDEETGSEETDEEAKETGNTDEQPVPAGD